MAKNKYYVVWNGRKPGIYDSWDACSKQIKGFSGARYKGFPTKWAAEKAYTEDAELYWGKSRNKVEQTGEVSSSTPEWESISVDAACSGNPGVMEYQGVHTSTGRQVFYKKFADGTNNIGEFLAIVHALALLKDDDPDMPIYTDSKTAQSWVRKKQCKSAYIAKHPGSNLVKVIRRAEQWLKNNTFSNRILKWDTKNWGEIPADFGRK